MPLDEPHSARPETRPCGAYCGESEHGGDDITEHDTGGLTNQQLVDSYDELAPPPAAPLHAGIPTPVAHVDWEALRAVTDELAARGYRQSGSAWVSDDGPDLWAGRVPRDDD